MPDLISSKEGYDYILTAEEVSSSPSALVPENIKLLGMTDKTYAEAESVVYNMENGSVTIALAEQEAYNQYYIAVINGTRYELKTEEILPAVPGAVSLRSVAVSEDGSSAEISVYNSTYTDKTIIITGSSSDGGEAVSAEIYVDAESVGKTAVSGENLGKYTWNAE